MGILRVVGYEVDDVMQGKWIKSHVTLAFIDGKILDKYLNTSNLGVFQ